MVPFPSPKLNTLHDPDHQLPNPPMTKRPRLFEPSIPNGVKQVLKTYITLGSNATEAVGNVPSHWTSPQPPDPNGYIAIRRWLIRKEFLKDNTGRLAAATQDYLGDVFTIVEALPSL
jgi:hypothetical protein